ncbi:MAG: cytochrome d ubiquinol oxidase subunit II [Phycisphaeraceae bacterium]
MSFETLCTLWFVILAFFLAGYAILDGFDLGVGILHPFLARSDHERRIFVNAIGPIWDGNEVWLIVYGGALFAAFPVAYAAIFSGFYNAFMIVLFALIFRAVSLEFRGKLQSPFWRRVWDGGFFLGSFLAALVFGVAIGNGMRGVEILPGGSLGATFLDLLNPYAITVGLLTIAMFAMHGAIFLYLKTPKGELHDRLREWMWHTWGLFLVLYVLTTIFTLVAVPRATAGLAAAAEAGRFPWAGLIVVVNVLAIANIPRAIYHGRPGQAFLSSCLNIAALVGLFSIALYPHLVPSLTDPDGGLTIFNTASGENTLWVMTFVAGIGTPLVLAYTAIVYWTFRGRVELTEHSY